MKEKKIVLTVDGMRSIGFNDDEVLAVLIHALVEAYMKVEGPVNEQATWKKIIDVLSEERDRMRINMLWRAIMGDDDDDEDEDDD